MNNLRIIALGIAVCLSLPRGANADTFFPTNATINTDQPLGDVHVGYANFNDLAAMTNGTSPTVTVVPGGGIDTAAAYNGSMIKVEGGVIHSGLNAFDHATVSLSSGGNDFGGFLRSFGQGSVIMSGGIIGSVVALESSTLDVSGGLILARVEVKGAATGGVSGVTIGRQVGGQFVEGEVETRDTGKLELGTVTVGLNVKARNSSEIKMTSATVVGGVEGLDTTTLLISGGSVGGSVFAYNLNMIGGAVGGGVAIGGTGAVGTVSGTNVGGSLSVSGAGASLSATGGMIGGGASAGGGTALSLSSLQVSSGVTGFNSTVSASGTTINGNLSIQASAVLSTATISESQIVGNVIATGGLSATKNATITFTGGSISEGVTANDRSSITLISTTVATDVTANGGSSAGSLVEIQGSTVSGNAFSKNSGGQVRLAGGTIMGNLTASNRGAVTILDGTVKGDLMLTGRSSGMMSGGSVEGTAQLDAITFTMTGGSIAKAMSVTQFSQFNFSNGTLGEGLALSEESTTIMTGGSIGGNLTGAGLSSLALSGGIINESVAGFGSGSIIMTGGTVLHDVEAQENSVVSVQGGIIGGNLKGHDSGVVSFSAGTVGGSAFANGVATLNVSGSAVIAGNLESNNASIVNITGGQVGGSVGANATSQLNVSGSAVIAGDLNINNASTVNITGGQVDGVVNALNASKLNVSDNAVLPGGLIGRDDAQIKISGGGLGATGPALAVQLESHSTLELSGGFIAGKLLALDQSSVAMLGGSVGGIEAYGDNPTAGFTISGGQIIGNAEAFNESGIRLVAGTVGGFVHAKDSSVVELKGTAAISLDMRGLDFSTINMSGGSVAHLIAQDNATIKLSGGSVLGILRGFGGTIEVSGSPTVGEIQVDDTCNFRILSGRILQPPQGAAGSLLAAGGKLQAAVGEPPRLTVSDAATLSIFGGGLVATLVDPNFEGMFSRYQLSGLMSDGTSIDGGSFLIQNGSQATYRLVPGGHWQIDSGGSWGLAANWASAAVPEGAGAFAQFPGALTTPNSPGHINLDGNRTLGSVRFDSANPYIIHPGSGGGLTLDNSGLPADLTVQSGQHQIAVRVIAQDDTTALIESGASLVLEDGITFAAGETLTKTGAGELSAASVSGGALDVEAGVMRIFSESNLSELTIADGATLVLGSNLIPAATADAVLSAPGSNTLAVPEPSSFSLLIVAGMVLPWSRRNSANGSKIS